MDMPPSRYKVVEKGRRLIVVDRATGEQVRRQRHGRAQRAETPTMDAFRAEPPTPEPAPRALSPDDGAVFTTESWYDNRGPRQVTFGDNTMASLVFAGVALTVTLGVVLVVFGWPGLIVLAILFGNSRKRIRGGITRWLDSLEQS